MTLRDRLDALAETVQTLTLERDHGIENIELLKASLAARDTDIVKLEQSLMEAYTCRAERDALLETLTAEQDRAEQQLKEHVASVTVRRWANRAVSRCLVSWHAWTGSRMSIKEALEHIMSRLQNVLASKAFNTWHVMWSRQDQLRQLARKAVQHILNMHLASAFEAWLARSDWHRQIKAVSG